MEYLNNKKDLGVHSELFSDGVIDLFNAGVITNARKKLVQLEKQDLNHPKQAQKILDTLMATC